MIADQFHFLDAEPMRDGELELVLAERSCRLLLPFVRRDGLEELWITCGPDNPASLRTLERLGAELIEIADVPPTYPLPEGDQPPAHHQVTPCG